MYRGEGPEGLEAEEIRPAGFRYAECMQGDLIGELYCICMRSVVLTTCIFPLGLVCIYHMQNIGMGCSVHNLSIHGETLHDVCLRRRQKYAWTSCFNYKGQPNRRRQKLM